MPLQAVPPSSPISTAEWTKIIEKETHSLFFLGRSSFEEEGIEKKL
jgi:hypothetical protein